jgi:hypothetical protein
MPTTHLTTRRTKFSILINKSWPMFDL